MGVLSASFIFESLVSKSFVRAEKDITKKCITTVVEMSKRGKKIYSFSSGVACILGGYCHLLQFPYQAECIWFGNANGTRGTLQYEKSKGNSLALLFGSQRCIKKAT